MHVTSLRKVGGSVMLTVPPALLKELGLEAGLQVGLEIQGGELVVKPSRRRRYKLDDLLAQCDPNAEVTLEEREWVNAPEVGREVI